MLQNTPNLAPALLEGVRLLSLDAGNVLIFLDHARLSALVEAAGYRAPARMLVRTEGQAKRLAANGDLHRFPFAAENEPGADGWGAMVGTTLLCCGVPRDAISGLLDRLWSEHVAHNLWCAVPEGLPEALRDLRQNTSIKICVSSNSEGMLEPFLNSVGYGDCFDFVLDSGLEGVAKPDPVFFQRALVRANVRADEALHLGDMISTDIVGGLAAGFRVALIDPFSHWEGQYADVPRAASARAVAEALFAAAMR
jgi:FMN phosphatase YigB (HAD superfamily)